VIFSGRKRATEGSSFCGQEKTLSKQEMKRRAGNCFKKKAFNLNLDEGRILN
jgi:hypothetical protein